MMTELSDKDKLLLHAALCVSALNSWKYKALAELSRCGAKELVFQAPCNIDADEILRQAMDMAVPDLHEKGRSRIDEVGRLIYGVNDDTRKG